MILEFPLYKNDIIDLNRKTMKLFFEKSKNYLFVLLLLILASSFYVFKDKLGKTKEIPQQDTGYEARVNLIIDYGKDSVSKYELKTDNNDTAFSVLKKAAQENNINLETIQYDFGIFVKKIGESESSAKKSWIYYINNESGSIAADQQKVKDGDEIKWVYEVPKI